MKNFEAIKNNNNTKKYIFLSVNIKTYNLFTRI